MGRGEKRIFRGAVGRSATCTHALPRGPATADVPGYRTTGTGTGGRGDGGNGGRGRGRAPRRRQTAPDAACLIGATLSRDTAGRRKEKEPAAEARAGGRDWGREEERNARCEGDGGVGVGRREYNSPTDHDHDHDTNTMPGRLSALTRFPPRPTGLCGRPTARDDVKRPAASAHGTAHRTAQHSTQHTQHTQHSRALSQHSALTQHSLSTHSTHSTHSTRHTPQQHGTAPTAGQSGAHQARPAAAAAATAVQRFSTASPARIAASLHRAAAAVWGASGCLGALAEPCRCLGQRRHARESQRATCLPGWRQRQPPHLRVQWRGLRAAPAHIALLGYTPGCFGSAARFSPPALINRPTPPSDGRSLLCAARPSS